MSDDGTFTSENNTSEDNPYNLPSNDRIILFTEAITKMTSSIDRLIELQTMVTKTYNQNLSIREHNLHLPIEGYCIRCNELSHPASSCDGIIITCQLCGELGHKADIYPVESTRAIFARPGREAHTIRARSQSKKEEEIIDQAGSSNAYSLKVITEAANNHQSLEETGYTTTKINDKWYVVSDYIDGIANYVCIDSGNNPYSK